MIPDQHVLRVEVKIKLTGFTDPTEAWVGAAGYDVDAQTHSQVRKLTVSSQNYICTSIPHDGTVGIFVFHVVDPSGTSNSPDPRTVTVGYFVKEGTTWYHGTTEYTIRRFNCYDACIDSRKAFGDPNAEGRIEASSNAIAQSVVFANWTYRGGLFAGYMPWESSSDRSGVGRTQFWYDPGSIGIDASVLTLFRKGYDNSNAAVDRGTPELGVFMPLAGSANLASSGSALESGSKWGTRLEITPSGIPSGTNPTYRWDQNPITVPSQYLNDEYVNFGLQKYKEDGTLQGTGQTYDPKHLVVALTSESGLGSTGTNQWRYFASREYQGLYETGIYHDSQPRVWTLTEGTTSNFAITTVSE